MQNSVRNQLQSREQANQVVHAHTAQPVAASTVSGGGALGPNGRRLTFYEEARLIVPDGHTSIPQNYPSARVSLQEVRARNKVRIKTTVSKEDLQYVENFPDTKAEQKIYKYTCPICLRYFNTILVASCC